MNLESILTNGMPSFPIIVERQKPGYGFSWHSRFLR